MNAGTYTLTDPRYATSPGYPPTKLITMTFELKNYRLSKEGTYLWHPTVHVLDADDNVVETSPQPIKIADNKVLHARWVEITKEA